VFRTEPRTTTPKLNRNASIFRSFAAVYRVAVSFNGAKTGSQMNINENG